MIYKPNFKLVIEGREETQNLLEFIIVLSAKFHTQHCELKISNITPGIDEKIELYLGYDKLYPVFKGYITDISDKQVKYVKAKDEYIKLQNKKITASFNRTTPREIINSIISYPKVLSEKSFIQKHHFPIWNESIDTALRRIQKTWNLKNFVWFFDIEGNFHFHEVKKLKDYKTQISDEMIKVIHPRKDFTEVSLTKPTFDIYPLYTVKIFQKTYLVESVIHKYSDKRLNTTLKLSNLS